MPAEAERIFSTIVRSQQEKAGVSTGTGFGKNPGLRIRGKIYAMVVRGELVVKLARERVEELLTLGVGKRFNAGKTDRVMKEWVCVPLSASRKWAGLVNEARVFVGDDHSRRNAQATAAAATRPAVRPEKRHPPRKVPSSER